MHKTVVLNVVGLTASMLGDATPQLTAWSRGRALTRILPAFPAVTCTAQANYLTGRYPAAHGIVGNGWYDRESCEIRFWRQANALVQGPKLWDSARAADPGFTCANVFWWFNMYSSVDVSVTPRPMYPADGRKLPDVYTVPAVLRDELQGQLGTFPLFEFWGPRASIASSRWIAESAKLIERKHAPTLTLIYLPHLDYSLQRIGPGAPETQQDIRAVDELCGDLIRFYEERGADVIVLSEYGIRDVSTPVHVNRALRERGLIATRNELGLELLDAGASTAFAVADHQVAHVYLNDPARRSEVREALEKIPGVERVLDETGQRQFHVNHARSGDLVAIARPDAWFTYYYWLDDRRAPDFARTVDIHRKPGYDPVELFLDPAIRFPTLAVGWRLALRAMGFRTLLDVIPLDAALVRGSHGRPVGPADADAPLVISSHPPADTIDSVGVFDLILSHLRGPHAG
ncbi:MAG TPA: nucleotide pyrophosphatase/phosphodiesterase family protein [Vicinamibacterales bacterium]|nr:nucleotide pyrophosphatase/phosphodiesterase family protein [Vicinamibacterales bacterium]